MLSPIDLRFRFLVGLALVALSTGLRLVRCTVETVGSAVETVGLAESTVGSTVEVLPFTASIVVSELAREREFAWDVVIGGLFGVG